MRLSRDLKRMMMAGLLVLLAFAPGMLLPGAAKADEGVPYAGEDYATDQVYDELAPFGDWVYREDHAYVWLPREVEPDWRPFTVGNWISTEYGWYWESYEPFAWAVYHYGRWGFDDDYGWYWVPGDTWAPAWVRWRYGNEYVGWAPEPPAYDNYAYGAPAQYAPPPPRESWVFVEPRYLVSPAVRTYALPRTSVSIFFSSSTYVYRPQYRNGHVYNYGMPRDRWSRITGRHIEPRQIHRGQSRKRPAGWNRRQNRDVYAYAPNVKKGAGPRRPPKKVSQRPPRAKAVNANTNARPGRGPQAGRGQAQRNRAIGRDAGLGAPAYRGGRPGQVNRPDWKPNPYAGTPRAGTPRAGQAHSGKPNDARSKAAARANAQRHRDMSLAGPNRGGGRPDQAHRPGDGKPNAGNPNAGKPKAGNAKAGNAKAGQPNDAKARAARARAARAKAQGPRAASKVGGGKPGQAHRPGTKPKSQAKAGKPRPANANADKANTGKPNATRAIAQRNRAMSLAAPTRGAGRPPEAHPPRARPRPNANAGHANANKANTGKPNASKPKASKPKPPSAKAARPAPKNARAPHAKPKAAHAKPKAAHAKPRAKPQAAKVNRGGGGKRAAAYKANRDCGPRG